MVSPAGASLASLQPLQRLVVGNESWVQPSPRRAAV